MGVLDRIENMNSIHYYMYNRDKPQKYKLFQQYPLTLAMCCNLFCIIHTFSLANIQARQKVTKMSLVVKGQRIRSFYIQNYDVSHREMEYKLGSTSLLCWYLQSFS